MPGSAFVYVGTYTNRGSEGIYLYRLDQGSGALEPVGLVAQLENPSYLAFAPDGRCLYSVSEVTQYGGRQTGAVYAFARDSRTGALTPLGDQSSEGTGPCHLSVDATHRCVLVANYNNGVVAQLPVLADGGLGPATGVVQHRGTGADPGRQQGPHAHSIYPDPANRLAIALDLGLDRILCYRLEPDRGHLLPHAPHETPLAAGSGPRHFAFHPSGRYGYALTEMANTVVAFAYDGAAGALRELQTLSTLPSGFDQTSHGSEVLISPDGRFLYAANRGHDSLAVFRVDPDSGRLSLVEIAPCGGRNPRNFGIAPTGAFLLSGCMESDRICVFRRHADTGRLTPTGHQVEVPTPVCVKMVDA